MAIPSLISANIECDFVLISRASPLRKHPKIQINPPIAIRALLFSELNKYQRVVSHRLFLKKYISALFLPMGWETHNKVVIGRFWAILPVYFLLKSLKTRCFYSKVARHSLSLGNRAFSSNPEARVLSACKWSGKLNRYGVVLLDRKFFLSYSAPKKRGAFLHLQSVKKPTTRQTSDANEFVNAKSNAKKKPLLAR